MVSGGPLLWMHGETAWRLLNRLPKTTMTKEADMEIMARMLLRLNLIPDATKVRELFLGNVNEWMNIDPLPSSNPASEPARSGPTRPT